METVKSGENDASIGKEPNAKRHRGDPNAKKSVVVLFDSDVTVRENGEVYMPNTIEMAQLKKPEKGQFAKISLTSEMTEEDVHKELCFNFPILSYKRRLRCASAIENRTRLEFHGNPRLWDGALIRKFIRGNSALYVLAEGSRESDEPQVLPSGSVSEAATAPRNVLSQQKQPLFVKTRQEDFSAPPAYNKCVYRGKEILRRGSQQFLEHNRTAGKLTGWESRLQQSTFMSPSRKQENGTSSAALLGSQDRGQSATENLTFQHMQHGFIPSTTSTRKSSLEIKGLASEQSVNKDSMTTPVLHHYQADLATKATPLGSSSKQSMQPYVAQGAVLVASQNQMSSITDQRCLPGKRDPLSASVLNANQQGYPECLLQRGNEELTTQPPHPISGFPQQGLSLVQKRQNDSIVHTSADPGTVSEAATVLQNVVSQQKHPLFVKTGQEDFSAPPTYNKYVYRGKEIFCRGSQQFVEHSRTAGKLTGWESHLQQSTVMSPSRKQENGTSSAALLGSQDHGQRATENLTFQRMQDGFIPSATSTQKSSLEIKGLASEQSVNEDSVTTPVPHHYQADLGDKATLWGSSLKQSMQPYVAQGAVLMESQNVEDLTQISSIADQSYLTGKEDPLSALVSSANQQGHPGCFLQRGQEELTSQPPHPISSFPQQGLSLVQKRQNADPASENSVKPVSMASGSQHRELIDQTSEQEGTWQQVPPPAAAAAAHKNVSESIVTQETTSPSTEKLSVNERKRKRQPPDQNHQENLDLDQLLLDIMSDEGNLDPGYESTFQGESTDTEQSEDAVPVTEMFPCKGSTKGGERFCVIISHMIPSPIQSYVAQFGGCGTVPLMVNGLNTLSGITPGSNNPGLVNVTVMSEDESWIGGETKFLYVDQFTREELLLQLVTDSEMQRKMFECMHKGISSDLQTSDPSGEALPGSSGANHSRHAQSVRLLQFLVYKAAQIGGDKFIQMIFNTSAGKVVFNYYKNNAKLPEHVARANGHKVLAEYLQDMNNRLSEESNSDSGTETIDWLELKCAVYKEESLPCSDDAQMLKNCQPPSPKSDYDGSDYLADDELSACSSPSHSELSDTEHEDHSQDTITYRSLKKEKEENLPVESLFPLHLVGNQLNVIPSIKAENDAYEHKQLSSVEVESHGSKEVQEAGDLYLSSGLTYIALVAIDFGTTFSGFAFSFNYKEGEKAIHMNKEWAADRGYSTPKTPTCLLLNPDRSFNSFGYEAQDRYAELEEAEAREYYYFENFKMILHNDQNLNMETTVEAGNGKHVKALEIFTYAIHYLHKRALEVIRERTGDEHFSCRDIRWVLTVPAIWKPAAKQFMREAAYQAGLASPCNPEQIVIALEPEAASVYCQEREMRDYVTKSGNSDALVADILAHTPKHYVVIDIGGGTLDVTVHQIQGNGTIKEIHKATGGPFGGQKVNKQFIDLLGKIFSQKLIENYIRKNPVDWLCLINDFEVKKRGKRVCEGGTTRIRLPGSFVGKFSEDKGWDINAIIQERYSLEDIKVQRNEYLCLQPKIMRQLFDPVLGDIIAHLSNLFAKQELSEVETVFLVGGFANSLILQERIKRQFSNSYRIMVPPFASLAVVHGAVMYGQKPEVFESRIMSSTYGIRIHKLFLDGLHPESKKEVVNGVPRCKDIFFKFVKVNEAVRDGERRRFPGFSPLKGAEKQVRIDFYRSERADVEFVTDSGVEKVPGRGLVLETPEAWKTRDIEFNLFFGGTEIKVTAVNLTSNTESTASLDFLATN